MDLGLEGRVAVVAAASKGLGRACAEALAREGASVAICARGEEALRATEKHLGELGVRVHASICDLTEPGACERFVSEAAEVFGRVDVLVANNGGPPPGRADAIELDEWRAALEQNLLATVRLVRAALPHMRAGAWGRIIAITSQAAKQPMEGLVLSNAARAGVHGFLKTLAAEVAAEGITINAVMPGPFATDRMRSLAEQRAHREGITVDQALHGLSHGVPADRIGRPDEFGALVAFLAGEQAAFITGTSIQIDGGSLRTTF